MGNCNYCKEKIEPINYGRLDSCTKCGRDTHICLNCFHHDPTYNNQCKESQAERVVEKERSNFCDYFVPKTHGANSSPTLNDLKAKADSLFKKKT